jgi:ankyrin
LQAAFGRPEIFEMLLSRGANPSLPDETGLTPLHLAAANNRLDMLKMLLQHGAPVGAKTVDGVTPLHSAASSGNKEAAELLLSHDADLNAGGDSGTPLHAAVQKETGGVRQRRCSR